ncbi:uncharacterized protein N0V89_002401 [Didymosphaeria variabile]|uniref:Extracellular membrane protein CFEM domain-containing protein n=1 Tax=Didymosphaeria variabile TaxID=1932322 RepID=A0A9W8XUA3_9PLEO|nr:uncharacterized protein N0V89_002401 [Didymosphaeria variabile]KAJ4357825.1 hypothetical protein N0V89_002401 [Didymosphaeria variabile]
MFTKTLFAVAFAAVASVASAASPPGCLLGAVNTYDTPSDIKAVCSAKDITTQISKKCGDKAEDALSALADICNDAGVKVSTKLPTSASGTATPTGTGASSKSSGSADSTVSASPSSSSSSGSTENAAASGTTSGSPAESTGSAGTLEISAAALLAGLGVVVAAL